MRAFAPCSAGIIIRAITKSASAICASTSPAARCGWVSGAGIDAKEYALLSRLMMKAGSPVHREILYNDIYSWDNEPATNTLEVHIHNLREKIGKSRIRTVRVLAICWLTTSTRNRPWLCLQPKHGPCATGCC